MNSSIMKKLKYNNKPTYNKPSGYREYLREISDYSCEYCTITESECSGATFNIDHFRPKAYFPQYFSTCENLRYTCPRCNSYKNDKWIETEKGCIRNCEQCNNKACHENISRFIDNLYEDPQEVLELDDYGVLKAISGSNPADYTIKFLRLNRAQLIKLRKIRRFIDLWNEELLAKRKEILLRNENLSLKIKRFDELKRHTFHSPKEECMLKIISTTLELLQIQIDQELVLINDQLEKIEVLQKNRKISDDSFLNMI
ncbi:HNH endonuclease [Lachnoclostridium phytofermentans]|uniref:HNH domain-containing protein n=1 Tax=Lachnoclostridium phytofermentans (strain ATCC 700394 / DSM 18823 / ISDg) TaxID=357809 RepID=A9KS26_LACP7|nr:HNH endonuclease [Lachnoclostridium phytofermentans]ABX40657.1 hypothetical protein Cphy_0270 [Lachnoclostridium phytofermentans ISDg]